MDSSTDIYLCFGTGALLGSSQTDWPRTGGKDPVLLSGMAASSNNCGVRHQYSASGTTSCPRFPWIDLKLKLTRHEYNLVVARRTGPWKRRNHQIWRGGMPLARCALFWICLVQCQHTKILYLTHHIKILIFLHSISDHLFQIEKELELEPNVKFALYRDDNTNWRVQAVPLSPSSFTSRYTSLSVCLLVYISVWLSVCQSPLSCLPVYVLVGKPAYLASHSQAECISIDGSNFGVKSL